MLLYFGLPLLPFGTICWQALLSSYSTGNISIANELFQLYLSSSSQSHHHQHPPGTSQATSILQIWGCGGRNIPQGRGKRCVREMDRGHFVRGKSLCCWIDSIIITILVVLAIFVNHTFIMTGFCSFLLIMSSTSDNHHQ